MRNLSLDSDPLVSKFVSSTKLNLKLWPQSFQPTADHICYLLLLNVLLFALVAAVGDRMHGKLKFF